MTAVPFIAICIPTYKRPELLQKLLESIQAQTFQNYEILINDNSPDESVKKLVEGYIGRLAISYVLNQPPVTAVENGILVMRRARAPWIKVMHDDDWFATTTALQQFADAAANSGKDFIFCASNQVDLDTHKVSAELLNEDRKKMLDDSIFSLAYLNVIGHPSVVMHKKDVSVEYDPSFNWVLDVDYYIRYINQHNGYYYLPEQLVNIGKNSGQESNKYYKNPLVEIPEYFTLLSKYEHDLLLKNEYVFHLVWNMCKRYRIKNIAQVKSLGYTGILPAKLEEIIRVQQKIPRLILKQTPWSKKLMRRCFIQINQDLNK